MNKLKLAFILALFSASNAFALSLFGNPSLDRIIGNLGNIEFGSSKGGGVVASLQLIECEEAVELAREGQQEGAYGAAFLVGVIPNSVLNLKSSAHSKSTSQFGGEFNLGLNSQIELKVNSYSTRFAPHLEAGCLKYAQIVERDLVEFEGKSCLSVAFEIGQSTPYQLLYCPGSREVLSIFN